MIVIYLGTFFMREPVYCVSIQLINPLNTGGTILNEIKFEPATHATMHVVQIEHFFNIFKKCFLNFLNNRT